MDKVIRFSPASVLSRTPQCSKITSLTGNSSGKSFNTCTRGHVGWTGMRIKCQLGCPGRGRVQPFGAKKIPGVMGCSSSFLTPVFPVGEEKGKNLSRLVLNGLVGARDARCLSTLCILQVKRGDLGLPRPHSLLPSWWPASPTPRGAAGSAPVSCHPPRHSPRKALSSPALRRAGRALGWPGISLGQSALEIWGCSALTALIAPYCGWLSLSTITQGCLWGAKAQTTLPRRHHGPPQHQAEAA